MTQKLPSLCDSCLRATGPTKCQAFPVRIPDEILVWGETHVQPREGQKNNLTWVFKPGTEAEFNEWKEFQEQPLK